MTFNRRILLQVTLPAVLVGSLLLGTCVVGLHSLARLQANRSQVLSKDVASLRAAQELETRLRQFRFHTLMVVMDPTPARKALVATDHQQFEEALERARQAASQPEDLSLIRDIQDTYKEYRRDLDRAGRHLPAHPTVADYLAWADAHPTRRVVDPCEEFLRVHQTAMDASVRTGEEVIHQTRRTLILLGLLGSLGGLAWGFGVAWGLSRSITRLHVRLRDVHAHLDQELGSVRLSAEGNLRQLDAQLEMIVERVREVVGRLHEQEREMLRAEQLSAVGQLAAGVAHEIRNPLTSIKLLVGAAIRARGARPLSPEDLQVIHGEIERLEHKIQALLDFARPAEAQKHSLELGRLIRQAVGLVQTRLRQQNVTIQLVGCDAPVTIFADPDQMLSVLVNLFFNALDAMPRGGELRVTLEQEPDGMLRLDVADTGPGFDPKVVHRLFTPFVSTKATGTGLGLSVCRRVVEGHGGRLTAANLPQGGACLSVRLPVLSQEMAHADHSAGG